MKTDYEKSIELIDEHLLKLGEHFDVVQILCSTCEGDGTSTWRRGVGNHWARIGMAAEFIKADNRGDTAQKIAEAMHAEEDL